MFRLGYTRKRKWKNQIYL
ncbi:UNVERIFIED_CONTAM: hypothetical protein GTU68_041444 [Idotea baltica]|nr:hypothetical protein [Idotea baltica]